jgi:hypothetical protein
MKRHKCNFCLAYSSVLIVLVSSLLVSTVVHKGPIIFLKRAELTEGEFDAIITPKIPYDRYL